MKLAAVSSMLLAMLAPLAAGQVDGCPYEKDIGKVIIGPHRGGPYEAYPAPNWCFNRPTG